MDSAEPTVTVKAFDVKIVLAIAIPMVTNGLRLTSIVFDHHYCRHTLIVIRRIK